MVLYLHANFGNMGNISLFDKSSVDDLNLFLFF